MCISKWLLACNLGLFYLTGCCEFFDDPSCVRIAPYSPGLEWRSGKFVYPCGSLESDYSECDLNAELSVSELLAIAINNNPITRSSWRAARAAAYAYRVSLSPYFPSVNYTGTLTFENITVAERIGSGVANGTSGSTTRTNNTLEFLENQITANYLLLDFGGRSAQAELALQTLYAADWGHNFAMQQVMLSVLNYYTSYIGNKELVKANEQNLHDAEIALKSAQTMRNAGLSTLTDVLQAQSTVEQAKLNLQQAQGAEKTALGQLIIALGLPAETLLCVKNLPDQLPVIPISGSLGCLLELAKSKRPDIGAAIAAVKEQRALLGISFSSGLPILTTTGSLNRIHFIHDKNADGHVNSINLQLNAPLFQGFYYHNQMKQLREQIQQAIADVDVKVSQVSSEVVTNYYALKTAEEALPTSEANLEFSQRAYKGFVAQYKVGTASIIDLLNSLTTLSNARAQLVIIRMQWAASLANLAFAVGILEESSGFWEKKPPENLLKYGTEEAAQ